MSGPAQPGCYVFVDSRQLKLKPAQQHPTMRLQLWMASLAFVLACSLAWSVVAEPLGQAALDAIGHAPDASSGSGIAENEPIASDEERLDEMDGAQHALSARACVNNVVVRKRLCDSVAINRANLDIGCTCPALTDCT